MRRTTAALFLLLLAFPSGSVRSQSAIFLVRHAEKADAPNDPPLSRAGQRRARDLARHLKDAGITVIITSEYQRTIRTAEPLARALRIDPILVAAKEGDDLVARLREKHREDVVLIVGHSNTLPDLLKKLGHPAEVSIRDDEYDVLFLVVPRAGSSPQVLRLRY